MAFCRSFCMYIETRMACDIWDGRKFKESCSSVSCNAWSRIRKILKVLYSKVFFFFLLFYGYECHLSSGKSQDRKMRSYFPSFFVPSKLFMRLCLVKCNLRFPRSSCVTKQKYLLLRHWREKTLAKESLLPNRETGRGRTFGKRRGISGAKSDPEMMTNILLPRCIE